MAHRYSHPVTSFQAQEAPTLSDRVAEEVRALMARRRVRQIDIARALHIVQGQVSSRLTNKTPFALNEVAILADYFGVPIVDLLGEQNAQSPRPVAGGSELYASTDLNREPAGYRAERGLTSVEHVATVIEFPTWRRALEISIEATA